MKRAWAVVLLMSLAACSRGPAAELLPAQVAGWRRAAVEEIAGQNAPEPVTSIQRIVQASYTGAGEITARVYEVSAPAMGLDFVQRWQAPANVDYFYEGSYVAVITWDTPERPDLRLFSTALRTHLRSL